MKIHLALMVITLVGGLVFGLSENEWIAIILLFGLVVSLELTNTAVETIVDSFTSETHPGAKRAKDISAGAVLFASITAFLVALMIFLPHILAFFTH